MVRGLPVGLALLAGAAIGCSAGDDAGVTVVAAPPAVPPPPGVRELAIAEPEGRWAREGFVHVVPPVHLPSGRADEDLVEVWIRIPPGKVARWEDGAGGPELRYPVGTVVDRVEYARVGDSRIVVDVRGATVVPGGTERFHVLRREAPTVGAALFGVEWPRDDEAAHAWAVARISERVRATRPATSMPAKRADAFVRDLEHKNRCLRCHARGQAEVLAAGSRALVRRGTDGHGFYTPRTLWGDTVVVESYGRFDRNAVDPYVGVECPLGPILRRDAAAPPHCAGGGIPLGRRDVAAGLREVDGWTLQLCSARSSLAPQISSVGAPSPWIDAVARCAAEY